MSPGPFPATITITPQAPPNDEVILVDEYFPSERNRATRAQTRLLQCRSPGRQPLCDGESVFDVFTSSANSNLTSLN